MIDLGGELWSSMIDDDPKWRKRNKSPHSGVHGMVMMWRATWYAIRGFVGLVYVEIQSGAHSAHHTSTSPDVYPHDVTLSRSLTNW